jgi:hypothetical protein
MSVRRPARVGSSHRSQANHRRPCEKDIRKMQHRELPEFTGIGPPAPLRACSHSDMRRQQAAAGSCQSLRVCRVEISGKLHPGVSAAIVWSLMHGRHDERECTLARLGPKPMSIDRSARHRTSRPATMRQQDQGVRLAGRIPATSCQLIFAARARTRTPGHQFVTTNQRHSGFRIMRDFPQQHPCKQCHSTPEGGMCKKRLHVITPGCPCATVESILQAFTPRAHGFCSQKR